jgi:MFS family permease
LTDRQAAAAGRAGDRGRPGPPRPGAGPVFVAGQLFALLADGIFLVALPVLVRRGGGDAGSLGGILAGYGLARLVGFPIGGWLADRWGGRAGMLGADGVRVVLMIALGALGGAGVVGAGNLSVPTIGALVAAFGLVDGVFWPASTSVVRAWLPADRQPRGVSLLASVRTAAAMGGAVAGGPMVLGGRTRAGFLVAAGSFALSALAVAGIRRRPRLPATSSTTGPAAPGPGAIVVPDDGTASRARWSTVIRHMIESPVTRLALLVTVVLNLAYLGLTEVTLPSFALSDLGGGAAYGVVMTGFGAGAIIGVFGGVALVRRPGAAGSPSVWACCRASRWSSARSVTAWPCSPRPCWSAPACSRRSPCCCSRCCADRSTPG